MKKNLISISNLNFKYENNYILEDINLEIYEKDFIAIIGPNGGGKTTLLKLIINLLNLDDGEIKLNIESEKIGYVPQNTTFNKYFPITILEVVLMGFLTSKYPFFRYKKDDLKNAEDALEKVGLLKFKDRKIGNLSGGQRQRVFIARALCSNPLILFLDEPTSNIDINGTKEIYELLKELNKEITIIVVTHDISVIINYAKSVGFVNKKFIYHNNLKENNNKLKKIDGHFCEVELLEMFKGCKC